MHLKNYCYATALLASLGSFAHGSVEIIVTPEVSGIELFAGLSVAFTAKVNIDPATDQETQTPKGTYEWTVISGGGNYAPADINNGTKFLPVTQGSVTIWPNRAGWIGAKLSVSYMTKQGGMTTEEGHKSVEIFPVGG